MRFFAVVLIVALLGSTLLSCQESQDKKRVRAYAVEMLDWFETYETPFTDFPTGEAWKEHSLKGVAVLQSMAKGGIPTEMQDIHSRLLDTYEEEVQSWAARLASDIDCDEPSRQGVGLCGRTDSAAYQWGKVVSQWAWMLRDACQLPSLPEYVIQTTVAKACAEG